MGAALHKVSAAFQQGIRGGGGGRLLRGAVLLLVALGLVAPILAGLRETVLAASGILPALGHDRPGWEPLEALIALPGFGTSLRLTLWTGLAATLLSFLLAVGFVAALRLHGGEAGAGRLLAPFLAVPHAALAVGLAFLLAPSGWIARALAPLAGWDRPPDIATVNDGWGLALILGLMVKEVPFLVLALLSALSQVPVAAHMRVARALGYGPGIAWVKVVLPQAWPMLRLPVAAVLVHALTVVDMALILGPSNPPTLAVAVLRLTQDPDPAALLPASAGALLLGLLGLAGVALLFLAARLVRLLGRLWLRRGGRGLSTGPGLQLAAACVRGLMILGTLALLGLLLWSFAWRWSWPALLPQDWSLDPWTGAGSGWGAALLATLGLALATVLPALLLAVAWLEGEDLGRRGRARWAEALIYLPLLVPQMAFLYGLNVALLRAGLPTGWAAVAWGQALFVFPYVMIALSDPWRALDPRLARAAAALGAGPLRRLIAVKLPLLLRPILTAAAVGVAVSVAQYLPTLSLGAGRIATLTTEAVTLSASSDRRVTAVHAVLLALIPGLAYLAALLLPGLLRRRLAR